MFGHSVRSLGLLTLYQILILLFKHVDEGKLGGDMTEILLLAAVTTITVALRMI